MSKQEFVLNKVRQLNSNYRDQNQLCNGYNLLLKWLKIVKKIDLYIFKNLFDQFIRFLEDDIFVLRRVRASWRFFCIFFFFM